MGNVKLGSITFSSDEWVDLVQNIRTLAWLVKFASKGLSLSKQELLTQIHGKLIDLGQMVCKDEIVSSIKINLTYDD